MTASIPPDVFFGNLQRMLNIWASKNHTEQFDSIIVVNGKASKGNQKTIAILSWFLAGFNLADTILFFNRSQVQIYTSERKINFLSNFEKDDRMKAYNLEFVKKEEDSKAAYKKIWDDIHKGVANGRPKVGMLLNDTRVGAIAEDFDAFVKGANHEGVDVFNFFNECFEIKSVSEMQNMKKSGRVTAYFEDRYIKKIQKIIDKALKVKHSEVAKQITDMLSNEAELKKCVLKLKDHNLNKDLIEVGPVATLQSGGHYKHKLFTAADDSDVKSDCIIVGMGSLYRSYNSYVSRTLLIDPTDYQKQTYKKIEALSKIIIQNLRVGVVIADVYKTAKKFVSEHLSGLVMPKSLGFGIGVFIKENTLEITESNNNKIASGNVFLVDVSFVDIKYQTKQKGEKTFAVQLIDTVAVEEKGSEVMTGAVSKVLADISYSLDDDEDDEGANGGAGGSRKRDTDMQKSNIIEGSRRRRNNIVTNEKFKNQKERAEHQKTLKLKKLEELKERINENFSGDMKKQKMVEISRLQSYKHKEDLPRQLQKNLIYVDSKNNSILLPIKGVHVAFHIHILKSIVKSDEGKFASLRFNFHLPNAICNLSFPRFKEPSVFVKELTFRSQQISRMAEIEKQVKNLQKKIRLEMNEKNAKEDIVEQEKINLNRGKRPILRDLFPRPTVGQKKTKGNLECHFNGFRFTTAKGESIDVPFSNIKFAFFQPCEFEIIGAIHFRLNEPIIVQKKKTEDIQFYSEGGSTADDVVGRGRGSFGGRGEDSDDEERQKDARRKVDREFIAWTKACAQYIGGQFEFEIPNRVKGFYGTPYKSNCLIQPTKSCLINVTELPFFVMNIKDIEIACFERMFANLKSFDVTFVYRDYENHIRVNSIPVKEVERVKDFLDDKEIIFYDIGKSMNWSQFLTNIRYDFKKFVSDGGWTAWDSDEEQEEEELMEGDSVYSADEDEDDEDSYDDSDESDSDEYSEEGSDSEDSEEGEEDLSEEGLDWDEMEERAERDDRERMRKEIEKEKMGARKKR